MDTNFLRIIANPYLLKKNKEIKIKHNNEDILYKYLKESYPKTYLPPPIYKEITNEIDNIVIKHQSKIIVDEIIRNCLSKFD